jgi:hypothetical protein
MGQNTAGPDNSKLCGSRVRVSFSIVAGGTVVATRLERHSPNCLRI